MTDEQQWDVLGLGCITIDDLIYLPKFPDPDSKLKIDSTDRQCGGLTGTALVAAARLGSRCAYGGMLGTDELSGIVVRTLEMEGIDLSPTVFREGSRPIHSRILVENEHHTRTILYEIAGLTGADDLLPDAGTIRRTRTLFLDHYGMPGNIRCARIAREASIPVVADIERDDVPDLNHLLPLIDHLILSVDFALKLTGASSVEAAGRKLWAEDRHLVAITCGANGCFYLSAEDKGNLRHQPAFRVEVVDTTGCGDVFHGAYASALARDLGVDDRVRFASAAAALKATQPGGQRGIPSRDQVELFLRSR